MESLVTKVLRKYLSLFINNFAKENFNLSIMKGQGEYRNLELNNEVIQELLWIPTNLTVTRATCNQLNIQVSWTKLKTQPIVISLDKVEFFVKEPEEIKEMPSLLQKFKSSGSVNVSQREIMMGVTIEIKEISIKVETLPPPHLPTWNPVMEISMKNIVVQSTNENGEVVELPKTKVVDPKDATSCYMYKSVKAESATAIVLAQNGQKITIIEKSPITATLKSKWGVKEGNWLGGETQIVYQDLKFKVNLEEYSFLSYFVESMKAAFGRQVPEPSQPTPIDAAVPAAAAVLVKETAPVTATISDEYQTSLQFVIKNWHFELDSSSQGVKLHGKDFSVGLLSSRKLNKELKKFEYHTNLNLSTPSIKLSSFNSKNEENVLVESLEEPENSKDHVKGLFSIDFEWITQPLGIEKKAEENPVEKSEKFQLGFKTKELTASVKLTGLQIFLDALKWDSTYAFLVDRKEKSEKSEKEIEPKSEEKEEKKTEDSKIEIVKQQLNELRDLNDLKLSIEASKIVFIVPPSKNLMKSALNSDLELRGLKVAFGRIYLSNNPKWTNIPIIEAEGNKLFKRWKEEKEEEEEREEQKLVLQNLNRFSLNHKTLNRTAVQSDPLQLLLGGNSEENSESNSQKIEEKPEKKEEKEISGPPPVPKRPAGRERSGSGTLVDILPTSYAETAQGALQTIDQISSKIQSDSVYRFQFDFTQMVVDFIEFGNHMKTFTSKENLFNGDGLQFFARYSPSDNQKNSNVEFVFIGLNEILLSLSIEQLYHTSQLLQRFYADASRTPFPPSSPKVQKVAEEKSQKPEEKSEENQEKSENPSEKPEESGEKSNKIDVEKAVESTIEKLKKKIDLGIGKMDEVDIDKYDSYVDEQYVNSAGLFLRNVVEKSKEILAKSQFTFFSRIHKVHFHVPLNAFDGLDDPITYEKTFKDEKNRENMSKISSFGFDFIDFGVKYSPEAQNFVFRQRGLMTKDWKPSFLSSSLTVTPSPLGNSHPVKVYRMDPSQDYNCLFQLERTMKEKPTLDVGIQLRDMHIYVQNRDEEKAQKIQGNLISSEKMSHASEVLQSKAHNLKERAVALNQQYKESQLSLPDLQKIIQDGVNFFEERRSHFMSKFEQVKEKVQSKGSTITDELSQLDFTRGQRSEIKWEMEISDCEFRMITGDIDSKPNAAIKISNRKQKKQMVDKYSDLEHRLAQTEKLLVETQIKALKFQEYEEKFTEAKIECSKWQMDFMDMQRDFENLKLKLGPAPPVPSRNPFK